MTTPVPTNMVAATGAETIPAATAAVAVAETTTAVPTVFKVCFTLKSPFSSVNNDVIPLSIPLPKCSAFSPNVKLPSFFLTFLGEFFLSVLLK